MKHSILYKALSGIHLVLENYEEGELDVTHLDNLGRASITLNQLIGNQILVDAEVEQKPAVVEADDLDELGEIEEEPDELDELDDLDDDDEQADALLEDAYELLKDESKPGPTLLRNKLRIGAPRAKALLDKLVADGRIEVKKRATKKATKKPLSEVVEQLPKGDDLVVTDWLQPLIALDPDRRELYTQGVDPTTVTTPKDMARAAKAGADTVLIDAFIAGEKTDSGQVDGHMAKVSDKIQTKLDQVNAIFDDKGQLFDFVVRNGMNQDTIRDLVAMARYVKANKA